jgi:GNAT superfamily N-acetyltransferase
MTVKYRSTKNISKAKLHDLFLSNKWDSGNDPEKLQKALKGSHHVVSAWDGDVLVGVMNALSDGVMNVFFLYLIVHPRYQKKGIGRRMVELMLHKYRDYARKMVIAYDEALEFFQKCGFEVGENNAPMFVTYLTRY